MNIAAIRTALKAALDPTPAKAQPASDDSWFAAIQRANDQIRTTAKWLVTSFAAIGAILLGTIQLSSVGKLTNGSPGSRIVAAILGAGLAITGVIVALWFTSAVLIPFFNSFRLADEHPEITDRVLGGEHEVLGYGYDALKEKVRAAELAVDNANEAELAAAEANLDDLRTKKRVALTLVGSEVLSDKFSTARIAIIWGVVLAATGLGLFAWGANPPTAPTKTAVALGSAPVKLAVHLTPAGVAALAKPRGCSDPDTGALQIGGTTAAPELVTTPTDKKCLAMRFVLTPSIGTAAAAG
jgi:hypothetical protein